jgi:hypothetical protein
MGPQGRQQTTMPFSIGNLKPGLRWSHCERYTALILGAVVFVWGLVDLWVNGLEF